MLGGVCGAIARRIHKDPTIVRVGFVVAALVGFGVFVYVLAWLLVPLEGEDESIGARAIADPRGIAVAIALISIVGLALIVLSALGVSWIGSISSSLLVGVVGLVLVWRDSSPDEQERLRHVLQPVADLVSGSSTSRRGTVLRLLLAALLLAGGVAAVLAHHQTTVALRPIAGLLLVIAAIIIVLGPWWLRLARDLMGERQARARAEEREEMAVRVHDSVLQTLALIQRKSDDPVEVVRLARAQERELRGWLFEGRPVGSSSADDSLFSEAVRRIQHEVEAMHGAKVETVLVGDCELDDALRAMVAAGREATVNAAKWSGAAVISVFAEVDESRVSMFVRDTGAGFAVDEVPEDRRGLSDSIRGRMEKLGGQATIRSAPGSGTEVALVLPLKASSSSRRAPQSSPSGARGGRPS
jgi:signal transduction histidine kinase